MSLSGFGAAERGRRMAKTNPHGMTDQMFLFCQAYIKRGFKDATGAYRAAYPKCSEKAAGESASRLLSKNVKVRKYLAEVQARASEDVQVDANYVLKALKTEAEREGEGSTQSARVRAIELLGKHQGMFTDKRADEHGGEPEAEGWTPERLAALWEQVKQVRSLQELEKMFVDAAKKQMAHPPAGVFDRMLG